MGYSQNRAIYEHQLAIAHRALWRASEAAEEMGDGGAEHDCQQLLKELGRVAEHSLKSNPRARPQLKGQLSL